MPNSWYSSRGPSGGDYLVRTRSRATKPYVSSGSMAALTPREKAARMVTKTAASGLGGYGGGAGGAYGNTSMSMGGNFFSPQLSTDFLELPQSLREKREIYRHFYNTDELVGQAIDLHTELPLSKVRLAPPKPRTPPEGFEDAHDYGQYILDKFERMCRKIKLFQQLITIVHHYWLDGTVAVFAEDSVVDTPMSVGHDVQYDVQRSVDPDGNPVESPEAIWSEKVDADEKVLGYYQKNYMGWARLIVLPIDKVKITTFAFADTFKAELIPSDRDRALMDKAAQGDHDAQQMVSQMPAEVREYMARGRLIPLGTDPDEGSFVHILSGRKHAEDQVGQSILDRCHLPGTPVLAKREGQVIQIPIEDLDPDTDEVLAEGSWETFDHGSRDIDEDVTIIGVSKIEGSVSCTQDHRYTVLRDGDLADVLAKDIVPGDYLEVAQVELGETLDHQTFDSLFENVSEKYTARKSGVVVQQDITVDAVEGNTLTVRYSKPETNPRLQTHNASLQSAHDWVSQQTQPVTIRALNFCDQFGFSHSGLDSVLDQLKGLGAKISILGRPSPKSSAFDICIEPSRLEPLPTLKEVIKVFPRTIPLDSQSGYFLGYWLGDGHISQRDGLDYGVLGITYGTHVPLSQLSMSKAIKPFLDSMGVSWSESTSNNGTHLYGYQDAFIRWIAANFGHSSKDKKLPSWIFNAPKDFLWGLLRGLVDSDGDVTCKKDGSLSVRISSTNSSLADQIFLLLTSLGVAASRTAPTKPRVVKQACGRLSPSKPLYAVHFTHGPSVKAFFDSGFLAKSKNPPAWKNGRSGSLHKVFDGRLYYRVRSVGTSRHKGPVFSLNVSRVHRFYAGFVSTRNCLRTLYYREKLRQAQTQIASRAMTPKRIVWADGLSDTDVEMLREQVDLALVDPDYSIVANYEIRWEEMGARDRLLDLSVEYEQTERRLISGLGVTESLMSGEALYSGDRLKLEVINTRYLHLREILQNYVHEQLFEPVARRMGFVETDKWGNEVVLFPRLSFTRLPLRDSQDTFDALYNLYQKGSISIDLILEMLNIDPDDTRSKLEKDLFTVNDSSFNEIIRSVSNEVGRELAEKYNVTQKVADYLGLLDKAGGGEDTSRF